jgi:cell division protein FtsB
MDFRVEQFAKFRRLPRPEEGLRRVVEHAPEAEAALQQLVDRTRPVWSVLYRLRRRIATVTVAALAIGLFVHVMFGANGMVVYRQKRAEIRALQKEVFDLQQQTQTYQEQIKGLKTDPQAIEKEAREQLHYARPGEVVYVPPAPTTPQKPPVNSASNK